MRKSEFPPETCPLQSRVAITTKPAASQEILKPFKRFEKNGRRQRDVLFLINQRTEHFKIGRNNKRSCPITSRLLTRSNAVGSHILDNYEYQNPIKKGAMTYKIRFGKGVTTSVDLGRHSMASKAEQRLIGQGRCSYTARGQLHSGSGNG